MASSKDCGSFDEIETSQENQQQNQPTAGYDFKTKNVSPDVYQCIICHLLIRQFTELTCSHPYCKNSLLRWEQQKTEQNKRLNR